MTRLTPNPECSRIRIVAGRTSPPTCLVSWNGRDFVFSCARVREVAAAMQTAAARAEAEAAVLAFMRSQGASNELLGQVLTGLRGQYENRVLGIDGVITLVPSVSMFDGRPFAHANVKPYEPLRLSPAELRSTAADWVATAECAERDAILAYSLREALDMDGDQVERVFQVTRGIRVTDLPDTDPVGP